MLTQEYKIEGKKISMPVYFARRSLKRAKRHYLSTEIKHLLFWAVKTHKLYTMGMHFEVVFDHIVL